MVSLYVIHRSINFCHVTLLPPPIVDCNALVYDKCKLDKSGVTQNESKS